MPDAPASGSAARPSARPSRHDLLRLRFPRRRPVTALAAMLLGLLLGGPAEAEDESEPPALSAAAPGTSRAARTLRGDPAVALQRASDAVVGIEINGVDGASSNEMLGQFRAGSGVVIAEDGLVLTIGYLLLEAEEASLVLDSGRRVPARVLGVDLATGFGLVQALLPLQVPTAPLARDTRVRPDEVLMLVSGGSDGAISLARLAARRSFSGYWEYHIDSALFTQPPRTDHSGAGLFNARGELVGIGSLLVMDTPGEHDAGPGNMFVPVDLLAPILRDLRERGSSGASHRAWLGLNCLQEAEGVRVVRVNPESPAEAAGVEAGDLIRRIDGVAVSDLEGFYKRLWSGSAERRIALDLVRDGKPRHIDVQSVDRLLTLRRARSI
jgi:S1-C subfamily serine protease